MPAATITLTLAIYGAAVSTVALIWNIVRDARDRGRLRVELHIAHHRATHYITHEDPMAPGDVCLLTLTNIGRRPITASHLIGYGGPWCRRQWRRFPVLPEHIGGRLPHELTPGAQVAIPLPLMPYIAGLARLRRFVVHDTAGRRWPVARRSVRSVRHRCATVMRTSGGTT